MTDSTDGGFRVIPTFLNSTGLDQTAHSNLQALLDAWRDSASGNQKTFEELLDPNVTFHEADCLPYGGTYFGRDETLRVFYSILSRFWSLVSETHELLSSGEYCVSYLTMTFRVRETSPEISMSVTELFRFRQGKIIDWRVNYHDAAMVAEALKGESGDGRRDAESAI